MPQQQPQSTGAGLAGCYFLLNLIYICYSLSTAIPNYLVTAEYARKFGETPLVYELHRAQVIFIYLALVSLIWDCIWPPVVFDSKPKEHRSSRVMILIAGCLLFVLAAAGILGVTVCLIRGVPFWDGCKDYTNGNLFKEMILRVARARVKDERVSDEAEHLCQSFGRADWVTLVRSAERIFNGLITVCGLSQVRAIKLFQKYLGKLIAFIFKIIGFGFKIIGWILWVLVYPPRKFIGLVMQIVRFTRRWRKKTLERKAMADIETAMHPGSIPISALPIQRESQTSKISYDCPAASSKLEALLSHKPIFLAILRNSHIHTISNLIASSKFIYYHFTSLRGLSEGPDFLRSATCEQGAKFECASCSKPVCNGCYEERPPISAVTTLHLQMCEPRCRKCFFKKMRRRQKGLDGCEHLRAENKETEPWKVCSKCKEQPDEELVRLQEERDLNEMKHLLRRDVQCGKCAMTLSPSGLRWWACGICGSECYSQHHWAQ